MTSSHKSDVRPKAKRPRGHSYCKSGLPSETLDGFAGPP